MSKRSVFAHILRTLGREHFIGARAGDITYKTSSSEEVTRKRKIEKAAFEDATGFAPIPPAPPLLDIPDLYKDGKRCATCSKWRKATDFSPQRKRGKVYLKSQCKYCRAEEAYRLYHGLNSRVP